MKKGIKDDIDGFELSEDAIKQKCGLDRPEEVEDVKERLEDKF